MWSLQPNERLRYWQDFRKDLDGKPLKQVLLDVQHLWSYAPYVSNYLTTDHIEDWPNPWELLYDNHYCDLAKALGIVYTLYFTKHHPDLEIRIYNDITTKEKYNLVFVDQGKYILNYIHDEVVNKQHLNKDLELKRTILTSDLSLNKF